MVTHSQDRLHAFDAVRAFALLSGIVLHASMTFMPGLAAFGFPADSSQSPELQVVSYVIHIFRMTLFFLVAGYFARMLFHRKGPADFLRDRLKRILVPLLIGWILFGPLAMALIYTALGPSGQATPPPQSGFPLAHLWFLYYLLMFYGLTLVTRGGFVKFLDPHGKLRSRMDGWLYRLVRGHAAPAVLAAPVAASLYFTTGWFMWSGIPSPDTGFTPQLPAMIGFGTAFGFGWLSQRQGRLLDVWRRRWVAHLVLAVVFTALALRIAGSESADPAAVLPSIKLAYAVCYAFACWNWTFGILGAALRFLSVASPARRYVADSSYWLYLAHLPVVFALQMIVLEWDLHWSIKFPMIVVTAIGLLLLSYHYFVRNTYIGEILNGRRRSAVAVPPAVQSSEGHATGKTVVAELSRVSKRYGATRALHGVDLQIRAGELLALLGTNGAGKSTAISCLLGLQDPDEGFATVLGGSPHTVDNRREIGAMLQNADLPAELRVREVIDLAGSYYAAPMQVNEVMQLALISPLAHRPYAGLSGGQKRLVQFAVALCGRPKLLFLDEPTVGLDLQARQMLWATLRRLVGEGCSIVLTTHYLEEAEALADRVAVLSNGRIVTQGSLDEVRARITSTRVSCVTRLNADCVRRWPGVVSANDNDGRLNLIVADADEAVRRLSREDPGFSELKITRPGLAEAFTQITTEEVA